MNTRQDSPTTITSSTKISEHARQQETAKAPSFIDHLLAIPTKEDLFEHSQLNARDIDLECTKKAD